MLGHGAGGGVESRDLSAARDVALESGLDGRARRAAVPRRRPPLSGSRSAPRRGVDRRRRIASRRSGSPDSRSSSAAARRARGSLAAPQPRPAPSAFSVSPSRSSRPGGRALRRAACPSSTRSPSRHSSSRARTIASESLPAAAQRTVALVRGDHTPAQRPRRSPCRRTRLAGRGRSLDRRYNHPPRRDSRVAKGGGL